MATRISGVNVPENKRVVISLTYIQGIGRTTASNICKELKIESLTRVKDLTDEKVAEIRAYIDSNLKVESELKSEVIRNIKRLKDMGCYKGVRHRKSLPVRGQNTRSNARTRKGKPKTIANKKKAG